MNPPASQPAPGPDPVPRFRWAPVPVIGLALAVLAATLAWSALELRHRIRQQIVQRDGEILDAVTLLQHRNDEAAGQTITSLTDPGEQIQLALEVSKLRNVLGVRLYSTDGRFVNAFPVYITEAALPSSDLAPLQHLEPVSYFSANAPLLEQDLLAGTNGSAAPLLFVEVPLRVDGQAQPAGIIQFVMDGSSIAHQYAGLDRDLAYRFAVVFVGGGLIIAAGLGWAFRRLHISNGLLAGRTRDLLKANQELALSARVSAVGAVTAHLIHGLKNPLSGLASFVSSQSNGATNGHGTDWQLALSTTRRMQELVNRVVRVLQEQQNEVEYEITARELLGLVEQKIGPLADAAGVKFQTACHTSEALSNHQADLVLLVLENLAQNGVEATPAGKRVKLECMPTDQELRFELSDQGPGFPAGRVDSLFTPCASTKKNGGGIGLAISKQLAHHLGASLELASTSASGCIFTFDVPILKAAGYFPPGRRNIKPI